MITPNPFPNMYKKWACIVRVSSSRNNDRFLCPLHPPLPLATRSRILRSLHF
ncbi:hypothetical protein BJV74DRAFT_842575 [Russula compacta]|nr:hypothetical protein BJV74DRAFT_842575 [Russula compacta]